MFQFGCVDFFFNPNRSQHLYSTSLVIDKCQKAIKSLILDPNLDCCDNNNLVDFFMPTLALFSNATNATHLLESATNGSDRHELLLFLKYLSEIDWFDVYWHRGPGERDLTSAIMHWVCTTLVG
jgi:hypothetical protein